MTQGVQAGIITRFAEERIANSNFELWIANSKLGFEFECQIIQQVALG